MFVIVPLFFVSTFASFGDDIKHAYHNSIVVPEREKFLNATKEKLLECVSNSTCECFLSFTDIPIELGTLYHVSVVQDVLRTWYAGKPERMLAIRNALKEMCSEMKSEAPFLEVMEHRIHELILRFSGWCDT